jgi:hypothetical protein
LAPWDWVNKEDSVALGVSVPLLSERKFMKLWSMIKTLIRSLSAISIKIPSWLSSGEVVRDHPGAEKSPVRRLSTNLTAPKVFPFTMS